MAGPVSGMIVPSGATPGIRRKVRVLMRAFPSGSGDVGEGMIVWCKCGADGVCKVCSKKFFFRVGKEKKSGDDGEKEKKKKEKEKGKKIRWNSATKPDLTCAVAYTVLPVLPVALLLYS